MEGREKDTLTSICFLIAAAGNALVAFFLTKLKWVLRVREWSVSGYQQPARHEPSFNEFDQDLALVIAVCEDSISRAF